MPLRFRSFSLLGWLLCVLAFGGCAAEATSGETGGATIQLDLADGTQIAELAYVVSGNEIPDMSGAINTSAPGTTGSIEIYGIPSGQDYLITMTATSTDRETTCSGSASFDVSVGQVTNVIVILNCKLPRQLGSVRVNGKLNVCAALAKVVVSPLQTSVGNEIDVFAHASDIEGDEIEYQWAASNGSFTNPSAPITTYSCEEAGDHTLAVAVSDDDFAHCEQGWTVEIACLGDDGAGGSGGVGGVGGTGGGAGGSGGTGGVANKFPCSEQGIRDAIAVGGGPHSFDCDGPTVITTQAEIVIGNDVVLDGEGNLTIDGNDAHRVLSVNAGITAELIGIAVSGGRGVFSSGLLGAGIYNAGTLMLVGVALIDNDNLVGIGGGAAIHNEGTATLTDCQISGNRGRLSGDASGIQNAGSLTALRTAISDNSNSDLGAAVLNDSGTLTLIDSSVVRNYSANDTIRVADGSLTLVNSTVSESEGGACYPSDAVLVVGSSASVTVINSTLMPDPGHFWTILGGGSIYLANSIIGSTTSPICGSLAGCSGTVSSGGGNVETLTDSCGFTDSTDQVAVTEAALNLGPLADNGGPTETHALLPGSVGIDAIAAISCLDANGAPLTTDQRGEPRPESGGTMCDVGAFEAQP